MYNPFSLGLWLPVLSRQPAGVSDVALTYDDGPSPATTPALLETLRRAGATATFFLNGVRVAAHPGLAADIVAAGHAVYGHGWEHENLERAPPGRALAAMYRVEELLARLRPTPSTYLIRLPFNAGYNRVRMHREMARFHPDARFAWCSLSTRDYALARGCRSVEELQARCRKLAARLQMVPDLAGSIVLLHEDPLGAQGDLAPGVAAALLPLLLEAIAARGLQAGLIRTGTPHRLRDRFVLFAGRGDVRLWSEASA